MLPAKVKIFILDSMNATETVQRLKVEREKKIKMEVTNGRKETQGNLNQMINFWRDVLCRSS